MLSWLKRAFTGDKALKLVPNIYCAFCLRRQEQVARMVAASIQGVFICDECVDRCREIIDEDAKPEGDHPGETPVVDDL
ncbi:MAG: ClpX C4-type zinc finger protein [Chloroflexota bacterium]